MLILTVWSCKLTAKLAVINIWILRHRPPQANKLSPLVPTYHLQFCMTNCRASFAQ